MNMKDKSRFFSNIESAENALKFSEQLKYHADILSKTVAYITSKIESFGIQVHDEQLITKRIQEIFNIHVKSGLQYDGFFGS
jgi:hypothetical protein